MANDTQRDKARATFGKTFFANTKAQAPAKNEAVALQQRANARPIPTYKVGGVVKKQDGGRMARQSPEADDVLMSTPRGQRMLEEQRRREAAKAKAEAAKRAAADKLLGIPEQKNGGRAGDDFTGLMKQATARAAAKGNPVMKQGGTPTDYIGKRVNARMQAGNYADGGAAESRRDRKMMDIEKDYKIALAKGKNEGVAKAKYEQRKADAADDYAKWTKADRTVTSAAEKAAEAALKEARRTKGVSIDNRDAGEAFMKKNSNSIAPKIDVAETLKGLGVMPAAAPKAAAPKARQAQPVRQAQPARQAPPARQTPPSAPPSPPKAAAPVGVNAAFFKAPTGAPIGVEGTKGLKLKAPAPVQETVKPGVAAKAKSDATRVARLANVRGRPTTPEREPDTSGAVFPNSQKADLSRYFTVKDGKVIRRAAGGAGKVRKGMMKGC